MQPALDQLQKWDPANKDEVLSTYFRLSAPEGAPLAAGHAARLAGIGVPLPADARIPAALAAIAELLPPGTALVTGAYREEYPPSGERQVFNSIYVIGDDGTILDAYDKVHLVPFGEYVPLPEICSSGSGCDNCVPRRLLARAARGARSTLPFAPALPAAHLLREHLLRRGAAATGRGRASCST